MQLEEVVENQLGVKKSNRSMQRAYAAKFYVIKLAEREEESGRKAAADTYKSTINGIVL